MLSIYAKGQGSRGSLKAESSVAAFRRLHNPVINIPIIILEAYMHS